ncbi:MAG: DUF6498-containing protein [Planctomycetota bacterium]|jgi:hypothetical protein
MKFRKAMKDKKNNPKTTWICSTLSGLKNIPLLALLAANTIPLFGVLFFNWDSFSIVILYWAETFIIGFYNVLRMLLAKKKPRANLL